MVSAVNTAEGSGIIDRATALKELKQSSHTTGIFSNITAEMITEAENEPPPMPEFENNETAPLKAKADIIQKTTT